MNDLTIRSAENNRKRKDEPDYDEDTNDASSNQQKVSKVSPPNWKEITAENLHLKYHANFLTSAESRSFFGNLEREIEYFTGELARIRIFGKWHNIPRKQAAYGDTGLKYTFSGCTVPAMPWTPTLLTIKTNIEEIVPYKYNFCLVKYKDGADYMGEHRDDEKELDRESPIASVSLGQHRDFIFRHKDARGGQGSRKIESVKLVLDSGSLLLMNEPTNSYWYHSLPQRKKLPGVRINLTFRKIIQ